MFGGFYSGKRVLVTGHTGFKGAWLALWLRELGAEVHGFALDPPTTPNLYEIIRPRLAADADGCGDIRDFAAVSAALDRAGPDLVFHLAAQPLVRLSYAEPLETFATNALGTAHLLEAVRRRGQPCAVVVVTSDKCYENREWEFAYRENDPLGGHDVYSMSKAATELVAASWRRAFFQASDSPCICLATARAGNVIGGGDYARDRIVPDCVRALMAGEPIPVRNPHASRPWQHVLECLSGYLWLGACLAGAASAHDGGSAPASLQSAFNFGPGSGANRPVFEVVEALLRVWPGGRWENRRVLAGTAAPSPHEAGRLNLAIDKAESVLGWRPLWRFEESIEQTALWYQRRHAGRAADAAQLDFTRSQIAAYSALAELRRLPWATKDARLSPERPA
ncbi:MAG: CDP-glucose 4,6-dehydratase [Verrucomicrobia bacterium]|nr:CDP-glucose 4,6-dehydratase [Verrucomicrobiota bacterium]